MQTPTGSKQLIRAMNRSAVLNAAREHGPVTQPQLVRHCGLGAATVNAITAELLTEGWLHRVGSTSSGRQGGRPGSLLALNPTGRTALGVKVLEDRAELALVDLAGEVISNHSAALPRPGSVSTVDWIDQLSAAISAELGRASSPVLGVGIGVTGQVDSLGVVTGSRLFPGQPSVALGRSLANRLPVPVHLENDVTTLVVAELWFGAGRGEQNFVVVTIGRGIGAGLVLGGRLHRGLGGAAGELGHLVIDPDGPPCDCGRRGCLETLAADPALLRQAQTLGTTPDDPGLLTESGRQIGRAVAWLVTLTAPELVILTGEGLEPGGLRCDQLVQTLRANCFPPLSDRLRVVTEPMEFDAWARGAARVVLSHAFHPPAENPIGTSPIVHP